MDTYADITQADTDNMASLLREFTEKERNREIDRKQYPNFKAYFAAMSPESAARFAAADAQDKARREELEKWEPTAEDVAAIIAEKGWPTFEKIRYDHIDDQGERLKLETAVSTVQEFINEIQNGTSGLSMIMIANQVEGDMDRTGYGCGKTTLAKTAYYSNIQYNYARGLPQSLRVFPIGRFFSAREIMALFDSENFDQKYTFQSLGKVVVVDDLGREGTLKWEKRDLDMQLQEKQDRYYSLINYCYENGISLIITSNLTSREMATFLGGASWSRLLQMVPKKYRINMTGIRDMRPLLAEQEWF